MARANRTMLQGRICHLTHRCHDRQLLLEHSTDRNAYVDALREGLRTFLVDLLGYCVTSNHVHLLVVSEETAQVSRLMKKVQGEFGEAFNRREGRAGAFWSDRFHCTLVEGGPHLWNALLYVDLNMVRAKVVSHPRDWPWCGYAEIMGSTKVNPLIRLDRLCDLTGRSTLDFLRQDYSRAVDEMSSRETLARDPVWTESVAIGSRKYVEEAQKSIQWRVRWTSEEHPETPGQWSVRDTRMPYGVDLQPGSDSGT